VAVWQREDFEHLLQTCPWVADELRAVADRYQALAGAAMGLLGERLDDSMRALITDRAEVRLLAPGEQIHEQGEKVAGLSIVGAGNLELVIDGEVRGQLHPGDLPFAAGVLSHEKAAGGLRAGAQGALVLSVDRMTTHELLVSVPPLLELLATS
jgi:CRP-like cAMP-binding protein